MANAGTSRFNEVIHSKEREIIRSVFACCDEEARNKCLLVNLNKATEIAARYTGVSRSSVLRIRKLAAEHPNEALRFSTKKM
jgi:hypothetical protein